MPGILAIAVWADSSQVMFTVPQGLPSGETGRLFICKRLRNSQVLRRYDYGNPVVVA